VVEFRFGAEPEIVTYWTGEGACPYVVRGGIQVWAEPKDCYLLDRRGRLSLRGSWWNSGLGLNPKIATYWTGEGACPYAVRGGIQVLGSNQKIPLNLQETA